MRDLLKFITCGSVDDGKSTLIGHILYDSKRLYADQERALELASKVGSRGGEIDYSLLLDGLTEEREQGITIDVAYRYFTTGERSFIVADTPGHEEYTRNMAVGASMADLAVILVDARKGVIIQTRRHTRICSLMGIKYFVFAVNKMDLVEYSSERFIQISGQIEALKAELNLYSVAIIPVSATEGDNIKNNSRNTCWYDGPALLPYLERVEVKREHEEKGFVMPVQRVSRPDHTFRGFQGQIESGEISVGDEVNALPKNEHAKVKSIFVGDRQAEKAGAGYAVTICLDSEIDVSRGSVLERGSGITPADNVTVTLVWMDDTPLSSGGSYFVKLGTSLIPGVVSRILYSTDVNTGEQRNVDYIEKNEIARVQISFTDRIALDRFKVHRTMGELILIDRVSFMTSACGVVEEYGALERSVSDIAEARRIALGQQSVTILFEREDGFDEKLLECAERKLIGKGRHAYTLSEDLPSVAEHLNQAGIIVLALVEPDSELSGIRYDGEDNDTDSVVEFVWKNSFYNNNMILGSKGTKSESSLLE